MLTEVFRERLTLALSQDKRSLISIAKQSGYNTSYIRKLVKGVDKKNPTLFFVENMAITLDKPISWLLGFDPH